MTRRAIVTGASSGLGRALALELLHDGYTVALVGRNEKKLADFTANLAGDEKGRAKIVVADLSKEEDIRHLYAKCQTALGNEAPDLLVNCAGMAVTGRIQEIPREAYEHCWRVNFSSAVKLVQDALPGMLAKNSGTIVNVSSGVGRRALPFVSPYCSAKAALNSFTDSLRVELFHSKIRVLNFSPGPVESGFHGAQIHYGSDLEFPPFHGVGAREVGRKLYAAIRGKKTRVVLGFRASVAYHLNYWVPRFTDRLVARLYKVNPPTKSPAGQIENAS